MDNTLRIRILRNARLLLIVGIVACGLLLLTSMVNWYVGRELSSHYMTAVFDDAFAALRNAERVYHEQRLLELTAFLPPADVNARGAWATRIQQHLGQDVVVRLSMGTEVTDFPRYSSHPDSERHFPDPSRIMPMTAATDTLGGMIIVHNPQADSGSGMARFSVGPLGDSLLWSVTFRRESSWWPFLKSLDSAKSSKAFRVNGPVGLVGPSVWLHTGANTAKESPRLRARIGGKEVFSSPDLDPRLTAQSYSLPGVSVDLYASPQMLLYAQIMGGTTPHWGRWGLFALLIVILILNFRTLRWVTTL
jgi:hypothetical protein